MSFPLVRRGRQRGATRLEFAAVAIIVLILTSVYVRASRHYQEVAEQATVVLTIANIRAGMALDWAERIAKGKGSQNVGELVGANPVRWLESVPPNYLGELKSPRPDGLSAAHWYFDLTRQELAYVVNIGDHLEMNDPTQKKVLRWKVAPGENGKGLELGFGDLTLVSVTNYQWF